MSAIRRCTDEQFIAAWKETGGNIVAMCERHGFTGGPSVANRRRRIEKKRGITLLSGSPNSERNAEVKKKLGARRIELRVRDGVFLIISDCHVWPGDRTTAQRAAIVMARRLKPDYIIPNGDVFDGARISRFPAGIWTMEERPDVAGEIEACQSFLTDLHEAAPNADRIWLLGNHDMRFEMRLASQAPEFKNVKGFHLSHQFPGWQFAMALFVNDDLVIKHRYANGIHAVHNNAVKSGRSIVTGHLHSLKVTPWTDYNGTRYGVDCGTLADPEGPQFDYCEENPVNWRAGFVVLTLRGGKLLMPELVQVWDENNVEFRGEIIPV